MKANYGDVVTFEQDFRILLVSVGSVEDGLYETGVVELDRENYQCVEFYKETIDEVIKIYEKYVGKAISVSSLKGELRPIK